MKHSITIIITIILSMTLVSSLYEFGAIRSSTEKEKDKVLDSLRLERLVLNGEINKLEDLIKAQTNSFSSDKEKHEILARIFAVEEQILNKAKTVDDIKIVMDRILLNSPNLRKFPVIFPIRPGEGRISSTFGKRVAPKAGASSNHKGIDYAAPMGTPVYAAADGKVVSCAKGVRGYGNMVKIRHSFGFETIYGHLSSYVVSIGQEVKMGSIIAYVGNTGVSTGPHLHYEIIKNGSNLNPISFTHVMENKLNNKD